MMPYEFDVDINQKTKKKKKETRQNNTITHTPPGCDAIIARWHDTVSPRLGFFFFLLFIILDCFSFRPASAPLLIYEWRFDRTWFDGRLFIFLVLLWCYCYTASRVFLLACSYFDDASFRPVHVTSVFRRHSTFNPRLLQSLQDQNWCLYSKTNWRIVMAKWYQADWTSTSTATTPHFTPTTPFYFYFFSPPFYFLRFPPPFLLRFFLSAGGLLYVCLSLLYSFCFALARSALGSLEYWVIIITILTFTTYSTFLLSIIRIVLYNTVHLPLARIYKTQVTWIHP